MPKKPQRNGFYFFMKELEPSLRREGRVFPNGIADVVPIAHPRWKQLPEKDKQRFENMAKQEKARLRGRAGDEYRVDNVGNVLAHRKDRYTELDKRRMAEKKDIVKNWPLGKALKSEVFYFINFQVLCKTEEGDYLPAEIAVIEYSIEKGIMRDLHRFIEPGKIPTGYRFTCIQNSEDTHKIPVENFELADNNYRGLWIQLENFINFNGTKSENPPLYCLGAGHKYEAVEYCLDWIHAKACLGEPNRIHKVYEIESLFHEMQAHVGNQVSKTCCIDSLTSSEWDYEPKTKCAYHEELEVKDCALGIVHRYAYAISDALCQFFDVQITKNHLPARDDTGAITVLSPSSMPVCNKQDSRLPQKSDMMLKTKELKPRQPPLEEDYRELRRPNPPVPGYTNTLPAAPAWGGAGVGGAIAPVGGVYVNQADYPPMAAGRGLTVGMQGLSLNQTKHAGRAGAPRPSDAPPPPQAWQQPQVPSFQQPMGIGRGMVARNVPVRAPLVPSPNNGLAEEEDGNLAPLRLPGQTVSAPPQQQYQQSQQHFSQFADAEPKPTINGGTSYLPVGRGKGGLLEGFLKNGRKPGAPVGRGYAPPDWVDDGSLGPVRRQR
ncbi:protein maelstrom homolog [Mercenaria mercenaria]|uniref:protein maelstrom homolog n=1 Tax=Mercenaria mercenaria TaxID=6596 RepID=UPI00234F2450|nr:protein maelstrom homolog [Mercenaria mercenaria]XP_045165079.2 protein maelstrom homolog [Mercenaria mercenaria]